MYKELQYLSDRDLNEQIYIMLLQVMAKLNKMDNPAQEFVSNLTADLLGTRMIEQQDNARFKENK